MDALKSGVSSLKILWMSEKDNASKKHREITLGKIGELEGVMSTPEFLQMGKRTQGTVLLGRGHDHLRNHYDTEGGNADELDLAMLYFEASSKLGNQEATQSIKIQREKVEAIAFFDQGLNYLNGTDGTVNLIEGKWCIEMACELGLIAALEWRQKNCGIPWLVPLNFDENYPDRYK